MSRHRKPAGFLSRPRSAPSLEVDEWNADVPADPAVDVTDIEVDLPSVVGSQAAAPTVERIAPANVSPYISVGYAPVPQQTVAYPAPEPVAIAPEPEPVIETVVTCEPPVTYEPPVAFEPPVAYEPPAAFEPPAAYEPPMVQESPVSYEPPVAYAPPVEDVAPVAAEPPVAHDPPVADVLDADPAAARPLEPHVVRTNTSRTAYTPRIGPSRRVRRAAEKTSRRKRRLVIAAAVAAVAVAATAITVAIGGGTHRQPAGVTAPAPARQSTAVVMLAGARGDMVAGALVAFEPTGATSNAVLLPSKVIASIPGHGALQLAQVTEFDRATLPASTVSDMFGVRVDASWIVDESALQALVDRVGGITVDSVDTDVRASVGGKSVVVPAGTSQHLNGAQAVAFASYLAQGEDETARLARFQQVLTSVVAALPANSSDVPSFLSSFGAGSSLGGSATALATTLTGFRASYAANQSKVVTLPTTTIDS
ncbi:MAG: hypothetical protein QOI42_2241, partial [Frankiaceae bacterium]|nr:hypothetical protein [Frankiaceae bacterium]